MSGPAPGDSRRRAAETATRREFLLGGSAALASLAACSDILSRAEVAHYYLDDPALDAYQPVLDALATVVLPLEDRRFPLHDAPTVTGRLLDMFPLELERRFLGVQKTLLIFDRLELFPIVSGPVVDVERKQSSLSVSGERALEDELELRAARERELWSRFADRFQGGLPRFVELPLDQRRSYFELWSESQFVLRREFHQAVRALFFSTAYSLDEVWRAIGYAGPLIGSETPRTSLS